KGRGKVFEDVAVLSREGNTGAREKGIIGFSTLRGGDIVGDHTVSFCGGGERIELTHKASSRAIYAKGAIKAALCARNQRPGLYSMRDVLGLSNPLPFPEFLFHFRPISIVDTGSRLVHHAVAGINRRKRVCANSAA